MDQKNEKPEFLIVPIAAVEKFANYLARRPLVEAYEMFEMLKACKPYTPPAPTRAARKAKPEPAPEPAPEPEAP